MAKTLTKEDLKTIKDIVVGVIEPFAKAVQADFKRIDARLDKIEARLTNVEFEVRGLKERMDAMEKKQDEIFTHLDRLAAIYEKHDQEMVMMNAYVKRLEERIARLEKQNQTRS